MNHPAFSAVLLAGGRSSRMGGRDKAEILLPDGRPLWRRQLEDVLRPLGPAEIFLSGPPRGGVPGDVRVLPDAAPGLGPLSGVAAALAAAESSLVVVLAVDLPGMTAEFFRARLLPVVTPERGAAGVDGGGFYEPLAALYPRAAHGLALGRLRGTDRSLQGFVRETVRLGMLAAVPLHAGDAARFANWNRPGGPEVGRARATPPSPPDDAY